MGPQYEIVAALIGLLVAINVIEMFSGRAHGTARWAMCVMLLSAAAGYFVETPSVYLGIDRAMGLPNLSILLNYCAFLLCATVIHIWINTWPGTTDSGGPRAMARGPSNGTALLIGGVALTVDVGLFAWGSYPVEHPTDFAAAYIHQVSSVALVVWDMCAFTAIWGWAVVRVHRGRIAARGGRMPWLAPGLALLEIGMAGACVCAVITVVIPFAAASGLPTAQTHLVIVFESMIEAISGVAAGLGFSCRVWGPVWARLASRRPAGRTARAQFRKLDALYDLVAAGGDGDYGAQGGFRMLYRDSATALTYRVCAIIEARDKLAGYRDEQLEAEAAQWGRALAEVIALSAAADALRAGEIVPAAETGALGTPNDPPADTEDYLRMARALTMWRSTEGRYRPL